MHTDKNYQLATAIASAIVEYNLNDSFADVVSRLQKSLDEIADTPTVIPVFRENKDVELPTYSHTGDACMDARAAWIEFCTDGLVICHTGLHIALPKGYELQVRPRSSLTKTTWYIPNTPGTVDEPYRGEIQIRYRNTNTDLEMYELKQSFPYKEGERCGQIIIHKFEEIQWDEVDEQEQLGTTNRGDGGHGSTGNE